jgi:hypothetical protein
VNELAGFSHGSEQAHREFSINGAAAGITEIAKLDAIDGKPVLSLATRIGTGRS